MSAFLDPLELEYVDGHIWRVTAPFDYAVGAPDGATVVHVPVNFLTDFASIPRVLWNLLPPASWYGKAAVIHDLLYRDGRIGALVIDRKYADDVLDEAMRVLAAARLLDVGARRGEFAELAERAVIYRGVRLGGFLTWRRYRKADVVTATP